MRNTSFTYRAVSLAIALWCAVVSVSLHAQKLYNLGGANILQTIDVTTLEVTELCQVESVLSDIAFAPDGTLYGVEQHTLFRVDSMTGELQTIREFGAATGWLTGLTIDASGRFYFSSAGAGAYHVLQYDPATDKLKDYGPLQWRHWDLEFFDGQLYASAGTDQINEGFLVSIDTADLAKSEMVIQYGVQSYALSAFNDPCGGGRMIASVNGAMLDLNTGQASKDSIPLLDPLYSVSAGTASRTSWLGSFSELVIEGTIVGPHSCVADLTTYIEVQVNTNRPGLMYSLNGGPFQKPNRLDGVELGVHVVSVKDTFGCVVYSEEIDIEVEFVPQGVTTIYPATCNLPNGSVEYVPESMGDFSFSIDGSNFQPTGVFYDLAPGNYTLFLINEYGCKAEVLFEITRRPAVDHQLLATAEHCEQDDGTITVMANGGVPPYSYALGQMAWQNEPYFDGLHKATYLVRTRDSEGCEITTTISVDSVPAPQLSGVVLGDALCDLDNGTIEVMTEGPHDFVHFEVQPGGMVNQSGIFSGLPPGAFEVIVSDTFGCYTAVNVELQDIKGPEITSVITTKDDCVGGNGTATIETTGGTGTLLFAIDGNTPGLESEFSDLHAGDHFILVTDENGCESTASIEIEREVGARILDVSSSPTLCDQFNGELKVLTDSSNVVFSINGDSEQEQNTFTGLKPGTYDLTIVDQYGCRDSVDVEVGSIPMGRILTLEAGDEECLASNGWIEVLSNDLPMSFSINDAPFSTQTVFDSLISGSYTVVSQDENGCLDSATSEIHRLELAVDYKLQVQDSECELGDGRIQLETETDVITSLNGATYTSSRLYDRLEAGRYNILLQDSKGCKAETDVVIDTYGCGAFVPNIFTPNGDGVNDLLEPVFDNEEYQLIDFVVVDRYGGVVHNCETDCVWDGSSKGQKVLPGVYTYRIHMMSFAGEDVLETGDITVLY